MDDFQQQYEKWRLKNGSWAEQQSKIQFELKLKEQMEQKELQRKLKNDFQTPYIIGYALVLILIIVLGVYGTYQDQSIVTFILYTIAAALYLFLFIIHFRIIKTDEIGVIARFSSPLPFQLESGLVFIPFFGMIFNLEKASKTYHTLELPNRQNDEEIKVTHGTTSVGTGDPLDTRLETKVRVILKYRLVNLINFLNNINNWERMEEQLGSEVISTIRIECAKYPLSINQSRREEISYVIEQKIRASAEVFGVEIDKVLLQDIDVGQEIDKAQKNLSVSAINVGANKNDASKILYNGMAAADVTKMFDFAKAEGLSKIARELGIDNTLALYQINTLANVFRKSGTDFYLYGGGGDLQQLFGSIISMYNSKNQPLS